MPLPDPNWNKPRRTNSPPNDLIRALKAQLALIEEQKRPEEVVRVFYGGAFGYLCAARILPESGDLLRIEVRKENGTVDWIVAPVSECSFMFSVSVPRPEEPEERVILGFAEHEQT